MNVRHLGLGALALGALLGFAGLATSDPEGSSRTGDSLGDRGALGGSKASDPTAEDAEDAEVGEAAPSVNEPAVPTPTHMAPALALHTAHGVVVDVDPQSGRGTVWETDVDLGVLALRRSRVLGRTRAGLFGAGWVSELESRVEQRGDGYVVSRAHGVSVFERLHDGVFVSMWGDVEYLRVVPGEGFDLLSGTGQRMVFHADGELAGIVGSAVLDRRRSDELGVVTPAGRLTLALDARGRVTSVRGPRGLRLDYRYERAELVAVTGAVPGGQRERSYAASADELVVREGEAVVLVAQHDGQGRPTRLASKDRTHTYAHTEDGLTLSAPEGRWQYTRTEDGWDLMTPQGRESVTLDGRGRPRAHQPADGGLRRFAYDPLGRPLPEAARPSPFATAFPAGPQGLRAELDDAGRVRALRARGASPDAPPVAAYDERGRLTERTGTDGRTTRFTYDERGLPIAQAGPAGTVRTSWDARGNLSEVHTPAGRTFRFRWEGARLVSEDGPGGRVDWLRNADGRRVGRRDGAGRELTYVSDDQGRLKAVYADEAHLRLERDSLGQVVARESEGGRFTYAYDDRGRQVRVETPRGVVLSTTYGAQDLTLSTPWGETTRVFDAQGRTRELRSPAGTFRFRYGPDGRRSALIYPNGVEVQIERDAQGRVRRQRATRAGQVTPLLDLASERDARQHRTSLTRDGVTVRFEHDAQGRLTEVRRAGSTVRYAYDADGNRTAVERDGATRAARTDALGRLLQLGDERLRYDGSGRLVERVRGSERDVFAYDAFGRLVRTQRAGQPEVRYAYDAQGRVSERRVGDAVTHLVYDGERLLAEFGPGDHERVYVYGPDLDEPLAYREDGTWTYLLLDERNSALAYVDAEGSLVDVAELDPFGELERAPEGRPLFFTGRPYDPRTGLVDLRARFYDPSLGRFLAPDPSGIRGGVNPYAYVDNDPFERRDPLGLLSWAEAKGLWNDYVAEPVTRRISDAGDWIDRKLPKPISGTINGLAALHPASIVLGEGSVSENLQQFKDTWKGLVGDRVVNDVEGAVDGAWQLHPASILLGEGTVAENLERWKGAWGGAADFWTPDGGAKEAFIGLGEGLAHAGTLGFYDPDWGGNPTSRFFGNIGGFAATMVAGGPILKGAFKAIGFVGRPLLPWLGRFGNLLGRIPGAAWLADKARPLGAALAWLGRAFTTPIDELIATGVRAPKPPLPPVGPPAAAPPSPAVVAGDTRGLAGALEGEAAGNATARAANGARAPPQGFGSTQPAGFDATAPTRRLPRVEFDATAPTRRLPKVEFDATAPTRRLPKPEVGPAPHQRPLNPLSDTSLARPPSGTPTPNGPNGVSFNRGVGGSTKPAVHPATTGDDVANVNMQGFGGRARPGRANNCTRCAVATEHTLAGSPRVAAPMPEGVRAAGFDYVNRAMGTTMRDWRALSGSKDALVRELELIENGRAIIAGSRAPGEIGHMFNAVVHDGRVMFIDGQSGLRVSLKKLEDFARYHILRTDLLRVR